MPGPRCWPCPNLSRKYVDVQTSGFQTYVQTGIRLQVSDSPTIDVTLQVGQVTQQVAVSASANMVQTQATSPPCDLNKAQRRTARALWRGPAFANSVMRKARYSTSSQNPPVTPIMSAAGNCNPGAKARKITVFCRDVR